SGVFSMPPTCPGERHLADVTQASWPAFGSAPTGLARIQQNHDSTLSKSPPPHRRHSIFHTPVLNRRRTQFSHYLLVLPYAPDFCAQPYGKKDARECGAGRRVGFVVHGLWPQNETSRGPEPC